MKYRRGVNVKALILEAEEDLSHLTPLRVD
jgi:hypothetical protein